MLCGAVERRDGIVLQPVEKWNVQSQARRVRDEGSEQYHYFYRRHTE